MAGSGHGLLDSPRALAAVAELTSDLAVQLALEQQERPSNLTAAATSALFGVLVQLGAPLFEREPEVVRAAAARQLGQVTDEATRSFLEVLAGGGGLELAARKGGRTGPLAEALGANVDHVTPHGAYATEASRAVLAELLEDCALRVDEVLLAKKLDPLDTRFAGFLSALAILGSHCLAPKRIARWRARLEGATASVDEQHRAPLAERLRRFDLACAHLASERAGG